MAPVLTHSNILANAWAFYADDVMVRVGAMQAEEERQMRECMSNRDNYDIEGIHSVIAYNEKQGWTRRANIARAILAEREAELKQPARIGAAHIWTNGEADTGIGAESATIVSDGDFIIDLEGVDAADRATVLEQFRFKLQDAFAVLWGCRTNVAFDYELVAAPLEEVSA